MPPLAPAAVRVVCCDDSLMIRRLLRAWLEEADDLEHAGEAANGLQTVELVRRVMPDVVVLDLDMPPYNGIYAIERIRSFSPDVPIVVYSGSAGSHLADQALAAGGTTFVPKSPSPDDLLGAIRAVTRAHR